MIEEEDENGKANYAGYVRECEHEQILEKGERENF